MWTDQQCRGKSAHSEADHLHPMRISGCKTKRSSIVVVFLMDVLVEPWCVEEPVHPVVAYVFTDKADGDTISPLKNSRERQVIAEVQVGCEGEGDAAQGEYDDDIIEDEILNASDVISLGCIQFGLNLVLGEQVVLVHEIE